MNTDTPNSVAELEIDHLSIESLTPEQLDYLNTGLAHNFGAQIRMEGILWVLEYDNKETRGPGWHTVAQVWEFLSK